MNILIPRESSWFSQICRTFASPVSFAKRSHNSSFHTSRPLISIFSDICSLNYKYLPTPTIRVPRKTNPKEIKENEGILAYEKRGKTTSRRAGRQPKIDSFVLWIRKRRPREVPGPFESTQLTRG